MIFFHLVIQLSPQKLSANNQILQSEKKLYHANLMKNWSELEKKYGQPVTEAMLWNIYYEKNKELKKLKKLN